MSTEARFWRALSILVTLLTAILPAYVAYNLFTKGSIPPKQISLREYTTNPMEDLSVLGQRIDLSLRIEGQTIDNIAIVRTFFTNVGTAPILRTDYDQNIAINVQEPWKIVAVENGIDRLLYTSASPRQFVEFKWKRISDTTFEAEPVLLNPNDQIVTNIYLTNTNFVNETTGRRRSSYRNVPRVEWKVRIANLPGVVRPPDIDLFSKDGYGYLLVVTLKDWALIFTIIASMLFQAWYLHILHHQGFISTIYTKDIFIIIGASFLSFAAAASISTYLFDVYATLGGPLKILLNALWIILHIAFLIFLFRKARRGSRSSRKDSSDV